MAEYSAGATSSGAAEGGTGGHKVPSKATSTGGANDDFREVRRTKKGMVESGDIKARFGLDQDQTINHITCN
jgi:hypothetical protein